MSFEGNNEDILPFVINPSLFEPTLCKIIELSYEFPFIRNTKTIKKTDKLPLFMVLKLQNMSDPSNKFIIRFCNTISQSFLVLREYYEYFMKNVRKKIEENSIATIIQEVETQQIQILEVKKIS